MNPALLLRTQVAVFQPLVQRRVLFSQALMCLVVLMLEPVMQGLVSGIFVMFFAIVCQGDCGYAKHHKPRQHPCS